MKKFRRTPIVVEAIQYHGLERDKVLRKIREASEWETWQGEDGGWRLEVPTVEGFVTAEPGDWITSQMFSSSELRFYPYKPETFGHIFEHIGE